MADDITLEELFKACLESADPNAPDLSAFRTSNCPSYREFETHSRGIRFLSVEEMRHVNRCADYCQLVLRHFKDIFRPAQLQFSTAAFQHLAAHHGESRGSVYGADLQSESGHGNGKAKVIVTDGPFLTEGGYLLLRLVIAEPRFDVERLPLELAMLDPEDRSARYFTFDLPTQTSEIVKMKIPGEYLSRHSWRALEQSGQLPFRFLVRPLGRSELISMG